MKRQSVINHYFEIASKSAKADAVDNTENSEYLSQADDAVGVGNTENLEHFPQTSSLTFDEPSPCAPLNDIGRVAESAAMSCCY